MAPAAITHVLIPFLVTFVLPGILSVPFIAKRTEINALSFAIYAALGGIFFQLAISFVAGITSSVPIAPHGRILLASGATIAALGWLIRRNHEQLRIRIGAYETASVAIVILMLFVLRGSLAGVTPPYFNPASDQYYWLAYAEASLHDPVFALAKIFTSEIHRPIFFLLAAPYTAFLPKTVEAYQNLMVAWTYGIYALIGIAMAELAMRNLERKMLGLMAVPALFSFHWINYYAISGDIAPQGLAIFLLIAGFVLWHEKKELGFLWLFLVIFYAIHLGTLVVFGLIAGMTALFSGSARLLMRVRRGTSAPSEPWHLFETAFFLPTVAVIFLYALYTGGVLRYFKPSLIMYYPQYEEHLTLFSQPYFGTEQKVLLYLAAAASVIAVMRKKDRGMALGFLVPWALLVTPLIAYHAFHASWQSFRYYLFLYPSAVVLALLVVQWFADGVAFAASRGIAKGFVFVVTLGFLPIFALAASNQQKMVVLDMLQGRDNGVTKNGRYAEMEKLVAIAKGAPAGSAGPVAMYPFSMPSTAVQWAFSPRETIVIGTPCEETRCPAMQTLIPKTIDFFAANPGAILVSRKDGTDTPIDPKILKPFVLAGETADFQVYLRK